MPKLNVSQAANLYGKSRMTLHRYLKSGRISSELSGDGQRLIDLSELIRVFGEPQGNVTGDTPPDTPPEFSPVTAPVTDVQVAMLEELKALRAEVKELREALLRIEYKPAEEVAEQRETVVHEPAMKQKPKPQSFADLLDF